MQNICIGYPWSFKELGDSVYDTFKHFWETNENNNVVRLFPMSGQSGKKKKSLGIQIYNSIAT